jgi:hypothetical protein
LQLVLCSKEESFIEPTEGMSLAAEAIMWPN